MLALSKLLDLAFAPLTWAIAASLAAALLLRRRPRAAVAVLLAATALLVFFAVEPVAGRLLRYAERSAVKTQRPGVVYDAVILLGGAMDEAAARATGEAQLSAGAERVLRTWEVLRAGEARHVLISGGLVWPHPGAVAEAELVARRLARWGVSPERIAVEASSRNTRENAVESARLVRARGWRTLLLVTSAAHMTRAMGCFRAAGLEPDALPVDRRGGDGRGEGWLPRARSLATSTDVLRELAGRVIYRILGYADG